MTHALTPEIGTPVLVKKPRFMPLWIARLLDKHIGQAGTVVSIEGGQYSSETLYGIVFNSANNASRSTAVYFADELELSPSGSKA